MQLRLANFKYRELYVEQEDKTIIFRENIYIRDIDLEAGIKHEVHSEQIVGWYYGKPNESDFNHYKDIDAPNELAIDYDETYAPSTDLTFCMRTVWHVTEVDGDNNYDIDLDSEEMVGWIHGELEDEPQEHEYLRTNGCKGIAY